MRNLQHSPARFAAWLAVILTFAACGGHESISPPSSQSKAAVQHSAAVYRSSKSAAHQTSYSPHPVQRNIPAGSAIYDVRMIRVVSALGVESFPESAVVAHTSSGLRITYRGVVHTFPPNAALESSTAQVIVPPGSITPSWLSGRRPNRIAGNEDAK